MKFTQLSIKGAFLIEMQEIKDERGSFARQFCKKEFAACGLDFDIKQCNVSRNYQAGVLRGMHYQQEPYAETKIVSCPQGAFFDVLVDLRKDSRTYLQWLGLELSDQNGKALYIPKNCAHGFQTLQDNTVVYYQIDGYYMPDYARGIRWDDPKIGIEWKKQSNIIINDRDKNYPLI